MSATYPLHIVVSPTLDRAARPPRLAHRNDPALVQDCIRGDESAWRELVYRYARLIYSIPRRYGFSEADAKDVMQNVFIIVLKNLKRLRDQTSLSAWLIAITHHETARMRKLLLQRAESPVELTDEILPLTDRELRVIVRRDLLRQAIDRLTATERALVTAFLTVPPLTYEELTARTGIPHGSIGPTRARCFRKLESILLGMGFER